ncbi:hypothetical protein [Fervidibacillus halotolerans]|uniref:YhgE/Pip domain-containing protein n=1 Tax=Fervidibacillus halotolerans TaxID=2980027 RepID=A0A9E8LXS3_9BACI|nr:hypothetical protein [Fervidibacillus halotolerans]WAA11693.1 hypothetical protein OE105_08670 [Fervidibacillus halotolerans]
MKRIFTIVFISIFIIPSLFASANNNTSSKAKEDEQFGRFSEKEEVVYVTLNEKGDQTGMYIVNRFVIDRPGIIIDYGPYTQLENLTDLQKMEQNGDEITFSASEDLFYYKGTVDHLPLPWDFDFTYQLNGENGSPKELLGKDGSFKMEITIRKNDNAMEGFFENYMLQISIAFHSGKFKNLKADEGIIANVGENKQVRFTVMPGNEKQLTITADVEKFQMGQIEITALPSSIAIDKPDSSHMKQEFTSLSNATFDLYNGIASFHQSLGQFLDGFTNLTEGSSQYQSGMERLDEGSQQLVDGGDSILSALETLNSTSFPSNEQKYENIQLLHQAIVNIEEGLTSTMDELANVKEGYDQAYQSLDTALRSLPDTQISDADIQKLYASNADPSIIHQLIENYHASVSVKEAYFTSQPSFQMLSDSLDNLIAFLQGMQFQLQQIADELNHLVQSMPTKDKTKQLQEALQSLTDTFKSFQIGVKGYVANIHNLTKEYENIHLGMRQFAKGKNNVLEGSQKLQKGAMALHHATKDLPNEVDEEIQKLFLEYDKSDYKPVSFASKKNTSVSSVQFVIKTEE